MLRKAWYAVCPSGALANQPQKYMVHGEAYVMYRDERGGVHTVQPHCPHRGCDLSLGHVESGELICPFHGWRFDGTGKCTHIPANTPTAPMPKRAFLRTYPTVEYADLVWIYTETALQGDPPPTYTTFPELAFSDWRYVPFHQTWNAHFTRVAESVLDVSHLPFVHSATTGENVDPAVQGPLYRASKTSIVIYPTPFAAKHPMEPVPATPEGASTEIELLFPNQWIIRTPFGDHGMMCTFLTFTPVNDRRTDIFGIVMRSFDIDAVWMDDFHLQYTLNIMAEDQAIIEHLTPQHAPFDFTSEAHVASDAPTIRFRAMLSRALRKEKQATLLDESVPAGADEN